MSERTLARWHINHCWYITLEWKLADLWIGVFWRRSPAPRVTHVWICLLPCVPIHVWHFWPAPEGLIAEDTPGTLARRRAWARKSIGW